MWRAEECGRGGSVQPRRLGREMGQQGDGRAAAPVGCGREEGRGGGRRDGEEGRGGGRRREEGGGDAAPRRPPRARAARRECPRLTARAAGACRGRAVGGRREEEGRGRRRAALACGGAADKAAARATEQLAPAAEHGQRGAHLEVGRREGSGMAQRGDGSKRAHGGGARDLEPAQRAEERGGRLAHLVRGAARTCLGSFPGGRASLRLSPARAPAPSPFRARAAPGRSAAAASPARSTRPCLSDVMQDQTTQYKMGVGLPCEGDETRRGRRRGGGGGLGGGEGGRGRGGREGRPCLRGCRHRRQGRAAHLQEASEKRQRRLQDGGDGRAEPRAPLPCRSSGECAAKCATSAAVGTVCK